MLQRIVIIMVALLLTAPAMAQDTRRLSPAEVERILEEAAQKRVAAERRAPRAIEGEIGVTIGTGGTREISGAAAVPIGEQGTAIIMIDAGETRRDGPRRRR